MPKSNFGITLIALIITIIVLLILAGVTLSMVMGESGLFGKANKAKEQTSYANAQKKVRLAVLNSYNSQGDLDSNELKENINNIDGLKEKIDGDIKYSLKITVDNYEFVINDNGKVNDKLPENSKDNPQKAGVEVELKEGWNENTVKGISVGKGNQFVWIPCTADEYAKIDFGMANNNWDKTTPEEEKTKIEKYSGFYIGRYEAGVSKIEFANNKTLNEPISTGWWNNDFVSSKVINGKITCKAGEIPYYHVDKKTATDMSITMYSDSKYVECSLVTGTQWDMAMRFISKEADYSDVKSTLM